MGLKLLEKYQSSTDMEFSENIKSLRESKNLTQTEVAEALEISKNTYISYEKGETQPRLNELKKLSVLYGKTISEICLESEKTTIDKALILQFEAVTKFTDEEKKCFNQVLAAMILKHHADRTERMYGGNRGPWVILYKCDECDFEDQIHCENPLAVIEQDSNHPEHSIKCPACRDGILIAKDELGVYP